MYDESAQNGNMYENDPALSVASSFGTAAKHGAPQPGIAPTSAATNASAPSSSSAPSFSWQKNTNTNATASAPTSEASSAPVLSPRLQVRGAAGNLASLRNVDPRYSAAEEDLLRKASPSGSSVPSSPAPTLSTNNEIRRTTPSISPRLRYTSQSRRTAAPIQETSPDTKAALALEKPSLLSSAQLQAEATTLPYQPQPSKHLNRLETPSHHTAAPNVNAQQSQTSAHLNAPSQPQRTAAPTLSAQAQQQRTATPTLGAQPQTQRAAAPTLGAQPQTQRAAAPTLGAQPYQPRTAATLGAPAQQQRTVAPTLGAQPQAQRATSQTLGAQPYQPRTAATLGAPAQQQRTAAPTLGAQPQAQRATSQTLGAQPYQPRTAATLGAPAQQQRTAAPTLGAQPQAQRATSQTLGAQPYQPRTAATLGAPTQQQRTAAPTLGAQPQTQRAAAPSLGAQPYQPRTAATLGAQTRTTAAPNVGTSAKMRGASSASPTLGAHTQRTQAPDPYQPGKAANYPATQTGSSVSATATAAHSSVSLAKSATAEATAKPRRRPSVPNQPVLKNGANNRGGAKAQSGRPIPTVSATPPKEFLKEKERKALLAQRVAEYNNIQSYYAGYMAYYEQQQNRLEQLIKDEKTSSIERKHLFEQQSDLYQKQRALFQLQTSLYEFVSSKNFDPSSSLPFTPLDDEAASGPKKFDKSPEEHWSAILGSEIKKQPKKQHKRESEKPYKITKKHESVLERRMRRMEELKRWEKEWKQYYKTDSFWRKQRYWGAFLFIVGVAILVGILNISNVLKWFAADYEVPLLPIETHDLKTNYRHSYIPVHKGDMVPVDSRLISEKSPYNVMALRNGGNLRIDKYSDVLIESLKTDKNERFLSGFFLRQGRVFAYSTPKSMVFMLTPQVRVTPVNDQNTMYAVALKTDAGGKQFTLLSVYRGMCVVGYTTGTLQTVRVNAGQSLKSYPTRLGVPEGLRLPDKWTKWNYSWDATDTYISPLASPKLSQDPEEEEEETLEEEANANAVEAFTKKQAADKQKEAKAKAKKKANKRKSKTKKTKN